MIESWEGLALECEAMDGLSPALRRRAKSAFRILKDVFGPDFIPGLNGGAVKHPLLVHVFNKAPWARAVLIELAADIQRIAKAANARSLLDRLRDDVRYSEAAHVLRHAARFAELGLDVHVDPKVSVNGRFRVPDLCIANDALGDRVYLELTSLGASEAEARSNKVFEVVSEPIRFCDMLFSGRLNCGVSVRHARELASKVKGAMEQSQRDACLEEISIPGVLDVVVAPRGLEDAFQVACREKSLTPASFQGPAHGVNEIARTAASVATKQRQLPIEQPGIVVVRGRGVLLHEGRLGELTMAVEERIEDLSHIVGVLIEGGYLGARIEQVHMTFGPHSYVKFVREDGLRTEQRLFVLNRYCEQKVTMATVTKIREAFGLS